MLVEAGAVRKFTLLVPKSEPRSRGDWGPAPAAMAFFASLSFCSAMNSCVTCLTSASRCFVLLQPANRAEPAARNNRENFTLILSKVVERRDDDYICPRLSWGHGYPRARPVANVTIVTSFNHLREYQSEILPIIFCCRFRPVGGLQQYKTS